MAGLRNVPCHKVSRNYFGDIFPDTIIPAGLQIANTRDTYYMSQENSKAAAEPIAILPHTLWNIRWWTYLPPKFGAAAPVGDL